jgi:hypothetical protein
MKPAERKQLEAALETDKNLITGTAILEWLTVRGITELNSAAALQGHRKHTCNCYDGK